MEFNRKMRKKWGESKKKFGSLEGNRKKNSVLLKGTEKTIRFSLREPKKNFGSPFGVAIGVVAREMGQNGSKLGGTEILFRSSFGASKGTEKKFRFSLIFDF